MEHAKGIYPTWRTGRGRTKTMPLRQIQMAPVAGVMYGGKLHRGLAEYVLPGTLRAKTLMDLEYLGIGMVGAHWHLAVKDSGHVILLLRCDETFGWIDPRTSVPAVRGWYRLAADGWKGSNKPMTYRRVQGGDVGPWTIWGFRDLPASGRPVDGPLHDAPALPLVLEG